MTIGLLIKGGTKNYADIQVHYISKLTDSVQIFDLIYNNTKVTAKTAKAYLDKLKDKIPDEITKLIIADSNYFKFITNIQKVSKKYGAIVQGVYPGYERFECVYVPNYKMLFKSPGSIDIISAGLRVIESGKIDIVHNEEYGLTHATDKEILDSLYKYPALTVDIEATGLTLDSSILSIAFAWNQHKGVSIYLPANGNYHTKKFLETYTGKLIFHNALYDVKILIRNWWMKHPTDYAGMLEGMKYFKNVHDTFLLAYLAKNATTHVSLKLKDLALEHVGNYAIDAEVLTNYPKYEILRYNLIDALATYYIWNKYKIHTLSEAYIQIFRPSILPLIKMMLVGLPMDSERVEEVHADLTKQELALHTDIQSNSYVQAFNTQLRIAACDKKNATLKKLRKTVDDFKDVVFNPDSHPQMVELLYEVFKLPVLDTTKKGAPKTDASTLIDLKNHTTDVDILSLLDSINKLAEVSKINGTFIKACRQERDFLHGSLKLGATQSGRLSSSSPNLQNLPAHGPMGKLVKSCFKAPIGWLFCGADFNALEERIGAILSKDPERIKVYTQGYDGHSLRAYKYFSDQMPDITEALANVDNRTDKEITKEEYLAGVINSIAIKYPDLRSKSKAPTFALQYKGTAYTLHKRSGFPMDQALQIEKAFHDLYKVSDDFNDSNKSFMEDNGYVECAFGLKLRTPIIEKCILGNSKTPHEAEAEVRSANNAVTQSWGMLLNRAVIAVNTRIEEAGYGTSILPVNMIHDAAYFIVKDDPIYVKFLNDVLIEEMEWNAHELINSKTIPMKAELEIGVSWDKLKPLANRISIEEVREHILDIYRDK